ncbi:MAG: tripartite tricarboxylate transporter substrate binding protein, partial [Proteobacteria bacterium]|nr:tripartite tricarboxylate transporter substrate binding protein [Pseudomonadota bacterium]
MRKSVFVLLSALLCAALLLPSQILAAEKYPTKPIRVVIAWGAGSSQDIPQRIAGEEARKHLGVPIAYVNTPGASGMTGAREVVKNAKPDGYTLLSFADSTWYPIFAGMTDYKMDEFELVANLFKQPLVAVVNKSAPWNTMKELAAYCKANPDKVRWAMTVGNQSHFIPMQIEKQTGAKFKFVAIPGGDVKRQAALLAGNVDGLLTYPSSVAEYVKAGKFKLLGVTYAERLKTYPDVPTFKEQGINVVYEFRVGLTGPKGISADKVKIIDDAYAKALKDPATVKRLEDLGFDTDFMDAATLKSFMAKFSKDLEEYAK